MGFTLDFADIALRAARRRAEEIGIAVSIAVLDRAAHPKAFCRMDGAWLGSIDVALRKAKTSVLFETESQSIWEFCKPGGQAEGLQTTNDGLVTFAGGIPIKTTAKELLGAIGVSGGQVAEDRMIAQAGLDALVQAWPAALKISNGS